MPDPRQQDHRLNKDGLVSYRYLVPREILINKKAQVFYEDFRLESNLFIFFSFIIKQAKFWLVRKSLLVRMKYYKVGFLNVKS